MEIKSPENQPPASQIDPDALSAAPKLCDLTAIK